MKKEKLLHQDWFAIDSVSAARGLLGKTVCVGDVSGIIVETESYTTDAASHAAKETPRSALMRQTYGHVYVYQTYGMYYCLNFTTDKHAPGAVLIRAIEPKEGIGQMAQNRNITLPHSSAFDQHSSALRELSSGPGKVCQALAITSAFSGTKIGRQIFVYDNDFVHPMEIVAAPRIGISQDTHLNWRFFLKNNLFVSR